MLSSFHMLPGLCPYYVQSRVDKMHIPIVKLLYVHIDPHFFLVISSRFICLVNYFIISPTNTTLKMITFTTILGGTRWCSRVRHCATNGKIAVSIPDGVSGIFHWHNPSNGFGGLGIASWPLVPKFAGSNPAEAVGFLRAKKSSACLPSEGK